MPHITFISKEQLLEFIENKENFKLAEVLGEDSYKEGHIPGAVSLPVTELEILAPKLLPDKNQRIVVYCADFLCQASTSAARKLMALGYTDVLDYKGGKKDWHDAGLPLIP